MPDPQMNRIRESKRRLRGVSLPLACWTPRDYRQGLRVRFPMSARAHLLGWMMDDDLVIERSINEDANQLPDGIHQQRFDGFQSHYGLAGKFFTLDEGRCSHDRLTCSWARFQVLARGGAANPALHCLLLCSTSEGCSINIHALLERSP